MKKFCRMLLAIVAACSLFVGTGTYVQAEEYQYDELNRVTKVTYEDGSWVEYSYDANGNITNVEVYNATPAEPSESEEESTEGTESAEGSEETGSTGETESTGESGSTEESESSEENESTEETGSTEDDDTQEESPIVTAVKEVVNWFKSFFSSIKKFFGF